MGVIRANLFRRAALTLAAGIAIALPMGARADYLSGLSVRVGGFFPVRSQIRSLTDFAMWGGGIDYKLPWGYHLLNGEHWATSVSVDFYYSDRAAGIARVIPVMINQIYTFEEQNGHSPYAGFGLGIDIFGGTVNGPFGGHQPTIVRAAGGLILGLNIDRHLYLEGRYDWVDAHHTTVAPDGFRGSVGYRF